MIRKQLGFNEQKTRIEQGLAQQKRIRSCEGQMLECVMNENEAEMKVI